MPSIKISDNLGLVLETPAAGALWKSVREKAVDLLASGNLRNVLNSSLGETALTPIGIGLQFHDGVNLGSADPGLAIRAGANGTIEIQHERPEFRGDDDSLPAPAGRAWVVTSVAAHAGAGSAQESAGAAFGFESESDLEIRNVRSFAASHRVVDAFKAAVGEFTVPVEVADLEGLPEEASVSVSGSGSLKVTATAEMSAAPNPLAIPGLPPAVPQIAIRAGASIAVSAGLRFGGAYELRIRRLNPDTVRFGYHRKTERQFTVGVEARTGLQAGIAGQDWLPMILQAVSSNPQGDTMALQSSGLTQDQIDDIQAGIKAGVQRSLEASLSAELSSLRTGDAAFLYDIDVKAMSNSDEARAAVRSALHGDLSLLPHTNGASLDGITLRRSILASSRERGLSLRINLLGILNYATISKLLVEGTVVTDALTGEVTITDQATGKRLRALMVNAPGNQNKIRRLFFEAMIATITYRASEVLKDVAVRTAHAYFEYHDRTDRQTMKDNLDALEAVGLIDAARGQALLAGHESFGPSTFLLQASYDDSQCRRIFFGDDNRPRTQEWYEQVARRALAALVRAGDEAAQRGAAAADDALWKRLRAAGSPSANLAILRDRFGAATPPALLAAIDGDFAFIAAFWAPSMHETARKLHDIRQFLRDNPGTTPDDSRIDELRSDLAEHLAGVARNTKERFGDPLGLIALHYAAQSSGQVTATLTCDSFALSLPVAAAAA